MTLGPSRNTKTDAANPSRTSHRGNAPSPRAARVVAKMSAAAAHIARTANSRCNALRHMAPFSGDDVYGRANGTSRRCSVRSDEGLEDRA